VWIDVVRPTIRESNTARAVSDALLVLSHLPTSLSFLLSFYFPSLLFSLFSFFRRYVSVYPLVVLPHPLNLHGVLIFCFSLSLSSSLLPSSRLSHIFHLFLRRVSVSFSLRSLSSGVFSIDYGTTIDLPDCARDPTGTVRTRINRE